MRILAIDPGSTESGVVRYDSDEHAVISSAVMSNDAVIGMLRLSGGDDAQLVIEDFESYGKEVGKSTFETIFASGRMVEAWERAGQDAGSYLTAYRLSRRAVKVHLCGGLSYRHPDTGNPMKVGDKEVRRALLERFPGTGGGKIKQVGTKPSPGPLYGIKSHGWSALALAVVYEETQ